MKVALGCDHAGFPMKAKVLEIVAALGHEVSDFGDDFQDFGLHGEARMVTA